MSSRFDPHVPSMASPMMFTRHCGSRFFRRFLLCAAVCVPIPCGTSLAADPPPDAVAVLAGACANCHGPDGRSVGAIPPIRGLDETHLRERLLAFRAGRAADATVMSRLMKGYDEGQIEALAKWFGRSPRS